MTEDTLALVESPAQFLHLLEWAHWQQAAERTRAVVLAPTETTSVEQLRQLALLASEEQISVEWHDSRSSTLARLQTLRRLSGRVARARRLVVGDPFSGMIQSLLFAAPPRETVLVDDGTATLEFASQLSGRRPLRRWDAAVSALDLARAPLARQAHRFFSGDQVRLFTVMPVTGLPPGRVHTHRYQWTRHRFGPPRTFPGVDIVGSSLVESGLVRPKEFVDAICALAAGGGRYFAHRKESASKLARLARINGLEVVRPKIPLEIELRRGPVAEKVVSFPSSVGYTLPLVLAGVATSLEVRPIPIEMLTSRASSAARRFLDQAGPERSGDRGNGWACIPA